MYMDFYLISHSNVVNNNLFQCLIIFMFYKTILNNCCSYKSINFYEFDHADIYISHENIITELMAEFEILLKEFPILVLQWFRRISSYNIYIIIIH